MLRDLGKLASEYRENTHSLDLDEEIALSDEFKDALRASGNFKSIDFGRATTVLTGSNDRKTIFPNQWLRIAALASDFVSELWRYREVFYSFIEDQGRLDKHEDIIRQLRSQGFSAHLTPGLESAELSQRQLKLLLVKYFEKNHADGSPEDFEQQAEWLIRFTTSYEWWSGQKTIDRVNDFFVSPVLSLAGVVAASHGLIGTLADKFARDELLRRTREDMISHKLPAESFRNGTDENREFASGGVNQIIYGAPGTGKSHYIDDKFGSRAFSKRVVFHPEYTFYDFVGAYKPTTLYRKSTELIADGKGSEFNKGEPLIDYRFVPGPFTEVLTEAWRNPSEMHTLIIEEINRANTAAVFGEVFQLLDRDNEGLSEYSIYPSPEMMDYLRSLEGIGESFDSGVKIPPNMNIVATMNSADQGVMPMDSAFKRRWNFKYLEINEIGADHSKTLIQYGGKEVPWGALILSVNQRLLDLGSNEDQLIGPYFIKPNELGDSRAMDKLLIYLWDDVVRFQREKFFHPSVRRFSTLSSRFKTEDVFLVGSRLDENMQAMQRVREDTSEIESEGGYPDAQSGEESDGTV